MLMMFMLFFNIHRICAWINDVSHVPNDDSHFLDFDPSSQVDFQAYLNPVHIIEM